MLTPDTLVLNGRFRIVRHLGSGGMGDVYVGEQVSLGRKVAVKVLNPQVSQQSAMAERFRREAKLLSAVDHPSVVGVIEYGQEGGASFLVMEFAEGDTLHMVLQNGPLTAARAKAILVQLADGLAAIHAAGIIHRDLKPENVVLTPHPSGEVARLLDFGIARLTSAGDSAVSQIGTVVGTPEYLSPEQATGAKVDERADLYSLGVLGYRCLTGELPFKGPSPRDFLVQHVKHRPKPLVEANPALAQEISLCTWVMQLLEKEPPRRPQSAKHFADALRGPRAAQRDRAAAGTPASPPLSAPRTPVAASSTALFASTVKGSGTAVFAALGSEQSGASGEVGGSGEVGAAGNVGAEGNAGAEGNFDLARSTAAFEEPAPSPVDTTSSRASRRSIYLVAAVLAFLAICLSLWQVLEASFENRVRALIEKGQVDSALAILDELGKDEFTPGLLSLRSVALHRKGRHSEEHTALRELPVDELDSLHEDVLTSLAEDFGKNESDPALVKLVASFPEALRNQNFLELAESPASAAQWGALRYLDEVKRAERIDLPMAYAAALTLKDCPTRIAAAKRLGKLADERTREALQTLATSSRDRGLLGKSNCGQQEASAALKRLDARAHE